MQKKIWKKLLLVAVMSVLCVAVGVTASALEPVGQCGDNVYWTFDETTGELVVSGEGDMWDYEVYESPFSFKPIIKNVVVEDGVTDIGDAAFFDCYANNIKLGMSISNIGYQSFYGCENLEYVEFSNSIIYIGKFAFGGSALKKVEIPDSVELIDDGAFAFCRWLESIKVDINNKNYSSDSVGVLFNNDKTVLIQYPIAKNVEPYSIPSSVTKISDYAFYGDVNFLTALTIPNNVKHIGFLAFANMEFLDKVIVKSMDVSLGEYSLCANEWQISGISREELINIYNNYLKTKDENLGEKLNEYITYADDILYIGTIYCHENSTAQAYAQANGINYITTHFYEGDWTYDYENMIRYRKCIHCDELETEVVEPSPSDEPVVPDEPQEETENDFFAKIIDLIKAFFELIASWFEK